MSGSSHPPRAGGLAHIGVLHGPGDELADALWPHVAGASVAGETVLAMVDDDVRRRLRAALGTEADSVEFAGAHDLAAPPAEHLWRRLPTPRTPGRRGLLINQYAPTPTHGAVLVARESGIDLLMRDLPVTVLCACPRDAERPVLEAFRASHPFLLEGASALENPRYRTPPDRCAAPLAAWGGRHALRVLFREVGDLAQVRTRAAALALDAALTREVVEVVALAAHEAAVLALGAHDLLGLADDAPDVGRPCALDGWLGTRRIAFEVQGPGLDSGRTRHDTGLAGPPTLTAVENLRVVRSFCGPSPVVVTTDARSVRITATAAGDAVPG